MNTTRSIQYVFGRALSNVAQQSIIIRTNQAGGEITSFASYL